MFDKVREYSENIKSRFTRPTQIVRRPVVRQYNVTKDTPKTYTIRAPFWYIERAIIDFRFATNSISFIKFGNDAALTNGILIKFNRKELFHMTSTACLGEFAYDVDILKDDAATKVHTLHSRYTFTKFSEGLDVRYSEGLLELIIQDDLSASDNLSLTFTFEGWYG